MRRASVVLLAFASLPLFPSAAASASFAASDGCFVAGQRWLGPALGVAGCAASHEGVIAFVSCDAWVCAFDVSVEARASGLPPGAHSLSTRADDSVAPSGTTSVCVAEEVSTGGALSCAGRATTLLLFSEHDCRFVGIESVATADGGVAVARAFTEFRVCLTEGGATFDAI